MGKDMELLGTLKNRYYEDSGLIYPKEDTRARVVHFKTIDDMDSSIAYCEKRNLVIQAGGNCGVWARKMSRLFNTVYTWEPDPINFGALVVNTANLENVVKFQAALGDKAGFVGLGHQPYGKIPHTLNCGATFVSGEGIVPTMRIDDFGFQHCDLIYLDIEGCEFAALKGAKRTIKSHRPVIALEDKGLSERYGVKEGEAPAWLVDNFEYKIVGNIRKDILLVPKENEHLKN